MGTSHKQNRIKTIKVFEMLKRMTAKEALSWNWRGFIDERSYQEKRVIKIESGNAGFFTRSWRKIQGETAEMVSCALGHAAALDFPDMSHYVVDLEYDDGRIERRRNPTNFLRFCEVVYGKFLELAKSDRWGEVFYEGSPPSIEWKKELQWRCRDIISKSASTNQKLALWLKLAQRYFPDAGKYSFAAMKRDALEMRDKADEKFGWDRTEGAPYAAMYCQAANHHRHFVLNGLLPNYDIPMVLEG